MPFYSSSSRQECPACGYNVDYTWKLEKFAQLDSPYDGKTLSQCPIVRREEFVVCRRCSYALGLDDEADEVQQNALAYLSRHSVPVEEEEEEVLDDAALSPTEESSETVAPGAEVPRTKATRK